MECPKIRYSDSSYVHDTSDIGKLVGVVPTIYESALGLDVTKKEDFIYRAKVIFAQGNIGFGAKLTQFQEYSCDFAANILWRIHKSYKQPLPEGRLFRNKQKIEGFAQRMLDIFLDCKDADTVEELFSPHAPFPLYEDDLDMLLVVIERLYLKKQQRKKEEHTKNSSTEKYHCEKPDEELIQNLLEDIVGPTTKKGNSRRRSRRQKKSKLKTSIKKTLSTAAAAAAKEPLPPSKNKKKCCHLEEKDEIPLCAICTDVTANITLHPCLHTEFCYECIKMWNKKSGTANFSCPFCRTTIEVAYPIVKRVAPTEVGIEFKYKKI